MVKSQNGWTAKDNTLSFVRCEAAGFRFWMANNDLKYIFEDFVSRFDKLVEKVTSGNVLDDWSYANRMVRGSVSVVSNHGSATAIDINALKHPRGKRNTFTAAAVAKLRKLLRRYKGLIRWGGDFSTTVDDMHFEWIGTESQASELVKLLKKEVDMPLSPADLKKISDLIDSRLEHFWTTARVIENVRVNPNDPPLAKLTPATAAKLNDLKLDKIRLALRPTE